MNEDKREMDELRQRRSKIDLEILALLQQRARLSREVGARGGEAKLPSTERDTLDALVGAAGEDLPAEAVRSIFREIHAACRALEAPVRVLCVGPGGESAARRQFGALAQYVAVFSARQAIEQVTTKEAQFAVLPYASHTEGSVPTTLDALRFSEARIIALIDAVEGPREDQMRYCVAALRPASRTGRDVTALLFTVKEDHPGALFESLKHFAERGVNLRKIQSRPSDGEGDLFFVEFSGHITDRPVVAAIEGMKKQTRSLTILGSFPA